MRSIRWIPLVTAFVIALGCASTEASSSSDQTTGAATTGSTGGKTQTNMEAYTNKIAVLETNQGTIKIAFFPDKSPSFVKNFIDLSKKGFYDGTRFHRVIPGFMIQGGDPNSKGKDRSIMGTGGPGYAIDDEFNDIQHERGIVSMASSGPNTAGSQFFIVVKAAHHLDGKYNVFGHVIEGMDVVDKIVALPRDPRDNPLEENPAVIKKITIEDAKKD